MSRYTATTSRLQLRAVTDQLVGTANELRRYSDACAQLIDGLDVGLPTPVELTAALDEIADPSVATTQLPPQLAALITAYEPDLTNDIVPTVEVAPLIERYRDDQHAAIIDAFAGSLDEMGFEVHQAASPTGTMLWAAAPDEVIAVEATLDGGVEIDHADCGTSSCVPRQAELLRTVARRGVHIDLTAAVVDEHHCPGGGDLFARWRALDPAPVERSSTRRTVNATRRREALR